MNLIFQLNLARYIGAQYFSMYRKVKEKVTLMILNSSWERGVYKPDISARPIAVDVN